MSQFLSSRATSPHRLTSNGLHRFAISLPDLPELRKQYASDIMPSIIAYAPPVYFKDKLMRKARRRTPRVRFPPVQPNAPEKNMYTPMAQTLAKARLCRNFPIQITAEKRVHRNSLRPDMSAKDHPDAPRPKNSAHNPIEEVPFDWHMSGLAIEFKTKLSHDPFFTPDEINAKPDGERHILRTDADSLAVFGQLAQYAGEIFAHQHRTHLYQLLIVHNFARFLYWDRGSVIVSDRFDYTTEEGSELLGDFFWRFSHMDSESRGWDSSVSKPSDADVETFTTAVKTFITNMDDPEKPERKIAGAEDTLNPSYIPYELNVSGHRVIVQKPFEVDRSPCGRATRAYLGYSLEKKRVVFLKDTWRVQITGLSPEAEIYATLKRAGVSHIPTVIAAGDVKNSNGQPQVTVTHEWADPEVRPEWLVVGSRVIKYTHHRLIQELSYHVSTAKNSREYTMAFRDVAQAMEEAFKKAKYLHRDISLGNVMLSAEGEGLLNDWDHSVKSEVPGSEPRNVFRTGTWAFMSIALLSDPLRVQEMVDDLESLFWVFLYGAIQYITGKIGSLSLKYFFYRTTQLIGDKTYDVGGTEKRMLLMDELVNSAAFNCQPLNNLVRGLAEDWRIYNDAWTQRRRRPLEYQLIKERFCRPTHWVERFNVALVEDGWLDADVVPARFPPQQPKQAESEAYHRRRSTILEMEAQVRGLEILSSADSGLGDVAEPYEVGQALIEPPGVLQPSARLPGFLTHMGSAPRSPSPGPAQTSAAAQADHIKFSRAMRSICSVRSNSSKRTVSDRGNDCDSEDGDPLSSPLAKKARIVSETDDEGPVVEGDNDEDELSAEEQEVLKELGVETTAGGLELRDDV